jgi:hypothetical protein
MARLSGVRFVAVLGTLTLVAGVLGVGLGSTPAGASTYTNVNTEAGLRTAFSDSSATQVDLTANITLTNCGAGAVSRSSSTALVVDGDGYTVTQTCPDSVFYQGGTSSLTFQNITITGGDSTGGLGSIFYGGGIDADGSVTLTNSTITANRLAGGGNSTLYGGGIFSLSTVTLTNSTISGNSLTGGSGSTLYGGGILANGSVTLTNSTITGNNVTGGSNSTLEGGGIWTYGTVTVTNSTITGNSANGGSGSHLYGGGIYATGLVTVTNSTITGNTLTGGNNSTLYGGGISVNGTVTVTNSTITGNSLTAGTDSTLFGGGILTGGNVTVTNSTISGNSLTGGSGSVLQGGGIDADNVTLVYATIDGNTAGTGANIAAGDLTSFASVVAQPLSGGANCYVRSTTSHGYNLEDDAGASCGFNTGTDLAPGTNPDLGPLGSNGGPTQTMVPGVASPLINAIPNGSCESDGATGITTDQRDFPRPSPPGGACDIGAVEVQSTTLAASARATQNLLEGIVIFNATLTSQATGQPIVGQMVKFTAGGASCTAPTNSRGVATCDVVGPLFVFVRIHSFTATFLGSVGYLPSSTTGTIRS